MYNFLLFSSHPSHSLPISLSQTQQNPKSPTLGHHQQPNHTHHQRDQPPSSTHQPPSSSNQPPSSTNQLPSPSNQPPQLHHHQPIRPNIINLLNHIDPHNRNPIQPKRNLNARNPIQPKQKPNQPHSTRNPLIKQPEIKESNQIGGEIRDQWRDQRSVVVAISGSGNQW